MIDTSDRILYSETNKNVSVHNLNKAYWAKYVYENSKDDKWIPFRFKSYHIYEDNPLCIFYNLKAEKALRIIQYKPEDYDKQYEYVHYITAWTAKTTISNVNMEELVICVLPTRKNNIIVKDLILTWLRGSDCTHKINEIYDKQYKG